MPLRRTRAHLPLLACWLYSYNGNNQHAMNSKLDQNRDMQQLRARPTRLLAPPCCLSSALHGFQGPSENSLLHASGRRQTPHPMPISVIAANARRPVVTCYQQPRLSLSAGRPIPLFCGLVLSCATQISLVCIKDQGPRANGPGDSGA